MSENIENNNNMEFRPGAKVRESVVRLWELIRKSGEILDDYAGRNGELAGENHNLSESLAELEKRWSALRKEHELIGRKYEFQMSRARALDIRSREIKNEKIAEAEGFLEEIENLRSEIELQNEINSELHILNDKLSRNYSDIHRELKDLEFARKEIARKNLDLHERADEINKYKDLTARLESRIHLFEKEAEEFEHMKEENARLMDIIDGCESELGEAYDRIELLGQQTEKDTQWAAEEKRELEKIIEEKDNQIAVGNAQILELKFEKNVINRQHEQAQETIADLGETINKKDEEIDRLKEALSGSQTENKELEQKIGEMNQLRIQTQKLGAVRIASDATIGRLQEKNKKLEQRIEPLIKTIDELENKYRQAEERTAEANRKCEHIRDELREARNEALIRTRKVDELKERCTRLEQELSSAHHEKEQTEEDLSRIDEIESEMQVLRNKLAEAENKARQARNECVIKENMLKEEYRRAANLQREIEELHEKPEKTESAEPADDSELRKLANMVESRNSQIEDMQLRIDEAESVASKKHEDLMKIEDEFTQLTRRYHSLDTKRRQAVASLDGIMQRIENMLNN